MTLKFYLGTATEIEARFGGPPVSTITTVSAVVSDSVLTVADASWMTVGLSIVVHQQKAVINTIDRNNLTLEENLLNLPAIGDKVFAYNADYTPYRNSDKPFSWADDLKTGGSTGNTFGSGEDIVLWNIDGEMAAPIEGNRFTIFDSVDPNKILFGGVITKVEQALLAIINGRFSYQYTVMGQGYTWEGNSVGIEEDPVFQVNAGDYLDYLRQKYTSLDIGEIDKTNSPKLDVIRLGFQRRFSDVGLQLAGTWPGSEFFIDNGRSNGKVYFRQKVTVQAPFTLNEAFLEQKGIQNVKMTTDIESTYNTILFPFYATQHRDPDYFVQSTVTDNAFLKTTVVLNGIPTNIDESLLLYDDFLDGTLNTDFFEDDTNNPSPPDGYIASDGFIIEGPINSVQGLQILNASANWGEVGRATDPIQTEPWTGDERQQIFLDELIVNSLGDAIICGIMDQSTIQTTIRQGSTTNTFDVSDPAKFKAQDRITVGPDATFIQSVNGNTLTVLPVLTGIPMAGETVQLLRLAKSRIKFGILLTAGGNIKIVKNSVEADPSAGPQTYTADTYSFRLYMQCFESTVSAGVSGVSLSSLGLVDATNFNPGDVIEIYSTGSRKEPERRVIAAKIGNVITYPATDALPQDGYRVRTLPKIVVQVKGGTYGVITGRTWTTIHTETNTYQADALVNIDKRGVLIILQKSLVGTISLFKTFNPPGVTGMIGSRYLFFGTQDADSADPDIDCLIRKVGPHYQIDFFPDTKTLWASGSTLEVRYDEKWEYHLSESDTEALKALARHRGHTITETTSYDDLIRLGGRVLDTIQLANSTLTFNEATSYVKSILDVSKNIQVTLQLDSNTYADSLAEAGQIILSELPNINDIEIKQVQVTEIPGGQNKDGRTLFFQTVTAGSVDRLSELLLKRQIKDSARLVVDDGARDDTFTSLRKYGFTETTAARDSFKTRECVAPTSLIYDGVNYTTWDCLRFIEPSIIIPLVTSDLLALAITETSSVVATTITSIATSDTISIAISDATHDVSTTISTSDALILSVIEVSTPPADTPLQIDNLYGWWDPASGVKLATGVSLWTDKVAGLNFIQPTGASQAAFFSSGMGTASLPLIRFDGVSDFLTSSIPSAGDWTVFIVTVNNRSDTSLPQSVDRVLSGQQNGGNFDGPYIETFNWYNNPGQRVVFPAANGAVIQAYKNGLSSPLTLDQGEFAVIAISFAGATPTPSVWELAITQDHNFKAQIDLGDVIFYNRALSANEIAQVSGYLYSKYNLPPISGLFGHWISTAGVTVDTTMGVNTVPIWTDQSGQNLTFNQTMKAKQATLVNAVGGNGTNFPVLRFDGFGSFMASTIPSAGDWTVFFVVADQRVDARLPNQVDRLLNGQEGSGSFNGPYLELFNYYGNATQRQAFAAANGAATVVYKNGVTSPLTLNLGEFSIITASFSGATATAINWSLCNFPGFCAQVDICEIIMYNRVLNAGEVAQQFQTLSNRYKISAPPGPVAINTSDTLSVSISGSSTVAGNSSSQQNISTKDTLTLSLTEHSNVPDQNTPALIPNLYGWWDPAQGTTIATGVSQWTDKINSHNLTQGTGVDQPSLQSSGMGVGSLPFLRFDGVNQFLTSALTATGDCTIFVVMKDQRTSLDSAVDRVINGQEGSGSFNGPYIETFNFYANPTQMQVTAAANGATVVPYKNGLTTPVTLAQGEFAVVAATFSSPTASTGVWELAVTGDHNFKAQVDIGDVIIYSRVLNSTEIGQVESYLENKYATSPIAGPPPPPPPPSGQLQWISSAGITLDTAMDINTVASWADQASGNHYLLTQSIKTKQPPFINSTGGIGKNLPILRFDGFGTFLTSSIFTTGDWTVFVVAANQRPSTRQSGAKDTVLNGQEGSGSFNGPHLECFNSAVSATQRQVTAATNGGIVVPGKNGVTSPLTMNQGEYCIMSATFSQATTGAGVWEVGVNNLHSLYAQIDVCEINLYSRILTSTEIASEISTLKARYGIP